ncbi:MAG: hypothetical protein JSS72_00780 [Armatimonadetes bacterium]|nr:hypothetical protein [Armatimonadota bacterium]
MNTTTASSTTEVLRTYATDSFNTASEEFVKDLQALSEESLGKSWSGTRTAYDVAYELGVLNRWLASWCREENPGPWPWEFGKEWLRAPAEFQNREAVIKHFQEAGQELLDSAGSDMERVVHVAEKSRPIYQLILGATKHIFYHDAQLNFIQELTGDMAVHW